MKRRRVPPPSHYNPAPSFGLRTVAGWNRRAYWLDQAATRWAPNNVDPWALISAIIEELAEFERRTIAAVIEHAPPPRRRPKYIGVALLPERQLP